MNLWDKKAKNYARYNPKPNLIQEQSFKKLKDLGVEFKDKILIDIGCGTGVWSLHLAKKVKELLAVDNSKAMLEIFNEDAQKFKINNIKIYPLSFRAFMALNPKFCCDIAFLSMAPALVSQKDYEDFIALASLKIYLGWASYRKSDFLDPIFKHFNTEFKGFYKEDLENFLIQKNLTFSRFVFEEVRQIQRSKEEALENALWHLQMNGVKASKNELEKFIKTNITETIKSKIKLLIF